MVMVTSKLLQSLRDCISNHSGAALLSLFLSGQPVPAARPRVGRYGTFYPKSYTNWIKGTWADVRKLDQIPTDRPVAVVVEAVFQKARTSKLTHPHPDVDNLAKGPLDQLTKLSKETEQKFGVWLDDKQVQVLVVGKRFAEPGEEPGFTVYWTELENE